AQDYRVYVMPANADIRSLGCGDISIRDAVYRCAGDREAHAIPVDPMGIPSDWIFTTYKGPIHDYIFDFSRTESEATLGYVYVDPAPGRIPVYVLGDP